MAGWLPNITSVSGTTFRVDTTHQGSILNRFAFKQTRQRILNAGDGVRYQMNNYFTNQIYALQNIILPRVMLPIKEDSYTVKVDQQIPQTALETIRSSMGKSGFGVRKSI